MTLLHSQCDIILACGMWRGGVVFENIYDIRNVLDVPLTRVYTEKLKVNIELANGQKTNNQATIYNMG